jgi:hypothetical protein
MFVGNGEAGVDLEMMKSMADAYFEYMAEKGVKL